MNKRILIVEDTPELLENLTDCLTALGYDVLPAANVNAGMKLLADGVPDLIITDLMMNEISGFDFIQKLKAKNKFRKIPLIIFSAKPIQEYREQALSMGVTNFIQKPSSLDEIDHTIKKILNE